MAKNITYKQFGEKAILIEWESIIDEKIIDDILVFKEKIKEETKINFVDLIQGYNSLTVIYHNQIDDFKSEVSILKSVYKLNLAITTQEYFKWEIPVCYDLKFGIDLEEISRNSNLEEKDIIKLHSEKIYKIYFIGFLPGFLYLGGLDKKIFFDRKPNPRLNIDEGSVAIGGKQTGIYPQNSSGGWNIIGKTPVNLFDVEKENPCFAKAGDFIKFRPISLDDFYQIEKEMKDHNYQISKTLHNA